MIPAYLYKTVFLYSVIGLTLCACFTIGRSAQSIRRGSNNFFVALILSLLYALFFGDRPISGFYFGDTYFYEHTFYLMKNHIFGSYLDSADWIWTNFSYACAQIMEVKGYFTIIAFGYLGCTLFACRILTKNNVLVSLLFVMGAFSFYTYGVNGIRNGLACAICLMVIALLATSQKNLFIGLVFSFLAINIHKTTMLPLVSLFASIYVVKSFKWAYTFWLLSIVISLVAGGAVTALFAGLGFDDRLSYLASMDEGMFSRTGFRWDFLIYSMMPIILGYYVVIKRGIQDRTYTILLNTYTLANAFWVMVIRANYSNRFAYLSWFMYPIVLAYPLLKLDIWGDRQGSRLKQIMLAHIGFTWFMETFIW